MINGTKLLNVAGMTRGRRDGILKSEKVRHVVKIGPMHLKGVWYVVFPLLIMLPDEAQANVGV
jgi:protein SOK2